jgi:Holliday junction DNA helicase RuvB
MKKVEYNFVTFSEEDIRDMQRSILDTVLHRKKATVHVADIFAPTTFDEYIGQAKAKQNVSIMVDAALKEQRPIPNILIDGPFGLGKTTLATLILKRAGIEPVLVDGAAVAKNMPTGTVIIDEIHNVPPDVCDSLNIALDRGELTVVGCTTTLGALPAAFRSRFRQVHLDLYSVADLTEILEKVAKRKGIQSTKPLLTQVAKRSRFTARIAINYLATIFDYMAVKSESTLTAKTMKEVFENLGLDEFGFLPRDYEYLKALNTEQPVGLQYLEAMINVDKATIEEEIEPYLMRMGLINRTPRGRLLIKDL